VVGHRGEQEDIIALSNHRSNPSEFRFTSCWIIAKEMIKFHGAQSVHWCLLEHESIDYVTVVVKRPQPSDFKELWPAKGLGAPHRRRIDTKDLRDMTGEKPASRAASSGVRSRGPQCPPQPRPTIGDRVLRERLAVDVSEEEDDDGDEEDSDENDPAFGSFEATKGDFPACQRVQGSPIRPVSDLYQVPIFSHALFLERTNRA